MSQINKENTAGSNPEYARGENEIDLFELWDIIRGGKWFIAGFTVLCTLIALAASVYLMVPRYRSYATIEATAKSRDAIVNYLNSNRFHRNVIEKYDLLKHFYPTSWDKKNNRWLATDENDAPSLERALSEDVFPLEVKTKGDLINLEWEGTERYLTAEMLSNIIDELKLYLDTEYISSARTQMVIYEEELGPLTERFEVVWDQFWELDKLTVASMEILNQYTKMKDRISMLKVEDVLSKKFSVLSEPIPPQEPFAPKKKLITILSFVLGLFVSVFFVFLAHFVKRQKGWQ